MSGYRIEFSRWSLGIIILAAWAHLAAGAADLPAVYVNPVMGGDHPDPSVIRVGKDFWATATSSEWGPQFQLMHSTDLVNWENTGPVFAHRPDWASANFWAPEIAEYKGRYFVYYVGRKKGGPLAVAVATAERPSGPYTDHGPLVAQEDGSIDPVPVTDEKGVRYLVWKEDGNSRRQPTPIWAQPLDEEGTKLTGEPKELVRNDSKWEGALVEGPFILRRGGWFYLFYSGSGCCGPGCDYALGVARSHTLLGPWEKDPGNPILAGNAHWRCPGHGSIVADEQGRYWLLYHAYSTSGTIFTGREALLDEVKFGADDWPTINGGAGPSASADSPFGVKQVKPRSSFVEEFKGGHLQPGWQWPQDNEPVTEMREGTLVFSPGPGYSTAVLARSTTAPDYTATAVLETSSIKTGVSAGLSAFGDAGHCIGLSLSNGKLSLWRRERGRISTLAETNAPACPRMQLRMVAKEGYHFRFLASEDGASWMGVGDGLSDKQLPPWDRSVRVALVVDGGEKAAARFDSVTIQSDQANEP